MKSIEHIPIDKIRLDGGTQPRAVLDFSAIDDYSDAIAAGAKFPPVTVFYDGENYWLADGFHRVKATFAAECDTIECEVYQGTLEDAQWFSYSANKNHGLRRTNSDKQRAIRAALLHPRSLDLSDVRLGKHLGVDGKTIGNWRERLSSEIPKIASRAVCRSGSTYQQDTSKIGKRRRKKPNPAPANADSARNEHASEPGAEPDAPSAPRTARAQRIDRVSRLIVSFLETTKRLAGLIGWLGETAGEFDRAEEVLAHVGEPIAAAIAEIEQAALAADPLNASRLGIGEGA